MAEYLSPGVYVEEFESGMRAMEGVSTSTAGFIGAAEKGPVVGTPVFLTSFADYTRTFGGYLSESSHGPTRFLPYAVEQFFANGGARCYVMRVAPSDAKVASAVMSSVVVSAKNPGKWGNNIKVTVAQSSKAKTQVEAVTEDMATASKMYTFKNASAFTSGDVVALIEKGNVVAHNRIVKIQDNVVTFENEFEGDIVDKNLVPKKIIASCEVNFEIVCGGDYEFYENVSFNRESTDFIENVLGKSSLVNIQYNQIDEIFPPMLAMSGDAASVVETFSLFGGSDGSAKVMDESMYIGGGDVPGRRTGLEAFKEITNVSIMAIPGITAPAVQLALVAHCQNLASRFAVLDVPLELSKPQDVLTHREIVDSDYAAMYHPWLQTYDMLAKKATYLPPSGAVCGIYARSDNTRGVHKAPANEVVNNCLGLSCLYNKGEQDLLNPAGVNLIRALPGQGIRIWGGRTCSSNSLWKYVNVRRLFIFLEETIKSQTNWAVFEPNDEVLWVRVRQTITSFLRDMYRNGALVGASEGEAFFVNIGYDTMTQQDILNGRLICEIGVAPSRPAEFVIFRITQFMKE
ncbi:phage tail sheath subtilisin-like domain-containing protein [Ruminococcaceae bacterium OttesenSCG-928-L11]|nr:phage tail sheath subtilisin-like domain-containing protein [Ruminococcaceae bacterium OttesenSCG-928-L11]